MSVCLAKITLRTYNLITPSAGINNTLPNIVTVTDHCHCTSWKLCQLKDNFNFEVHKDGYTYVRTFSNMFLKASASLDFVQVVIVLHKHMLNKLMLGNQRSKITYAQQQG